MPDFIIKNIGKTTNHAYLKATLLAFLFIALNIRSFSQTPVISSFNPTSGRSGSTVTINGTNFTNSGAVVYFGSAKATIISQNNTQIKVIVPAGADYQPLTVTANSLTGYSEKPFISTFNATGAINAQTFGNKINFSSNPTIGLSGTAVSDLNGDAKNDIIIANSGANSISILRNTSNAGNLSFAPAIVFPAQNYPVCVAAGDLDGDGKPDIAVTNFGSNSITVFSNTSTANNTSVKSQLLLQTGTNPFGISIADFDGDGRPDIVVANHYSDPATISVFRNLTISAGSISFAPRVDLPASYNPRELTTADIDNDGKPDIIVANQGASSISVFRNTSVNGTISFAPKVDLATPLNSVATANSWPESVAVGDLNGDGKLDIAVANNDSPGYLSVFTNNSTLANLAFLPRQDFSTGNNPYSISIGDLNGDGKPDIAVSNQVDNTISVLINSSNGNTIALNPHIDYATGNYPRSSNIADENGDGKPDLIVGNNNENTVSILLNNLTTALLPSVITFPEIANPKIDSNNNVNPGATSTNTETPITYTSSDTSVAKITPDGLIHLVGPGVTIITASQNGDSNYSPATPVTETLTVMETQVISFPAMSAKTTCDADFSTGAVSTNNTIPLIYTSSNPAVATISPQGTIHIISAGTTTITISQGGNSLYNPANPQSQILTVSSPIVPNVTIAPNYTSICSGQPVTYTAIVNNLTNNLTYQWQVNGINTGTNSNTFTYSNAATADKVQCIVTSNSSCPATGNSNVITGITVDSYITPAVTITSSATAPVCSGTSVTFTAIPTNGGTAPTYQWQVNGANTGTNSPAFTTSSLANGDMVTCTLTNNGGACLTMSTSVSNSITTSVISADNPAPSITISASANNVYARVPIQFTANVTNAGDGPVYQWHVNGIDAGTNSPTFTSSTLNNGDMVTCTLFVKNNCTPPVTSQPISLNILPPTALHIPNAFTPNGDGVNDLWEIPDLIYYPNCVLNVYTRYGSVVYQSKGYKSDWDGSFNEKPLPTGTYYYIIDLGDSTPKLSGWVAIIK
ncbi:MAG TPA: FG-GAP-like repeat-containing protein [Mucilaginibacter sp.]|nr:FG-GAP-like repeat-containing protein [Mucilaginibacter sp.]